MARGNLDITQIQDAQKHGTSIKVQLSDGTGVTGHAPVYTADGSLTDGGAGGGGFWVGGSGGAIYYSSGNVGIGQSSPPAQLSVLGASTYAPSLAYQSAASVIVNASASECAIGFQSTHEVWIQARNSSSAAQPLLLNPLGGNVGIGTASPQVLLDLPGYKTSNSQVRIGTLEIQPYALNNSIISDNLYYNGSNWLYRNNGYGSQLTFNAGTLTVYIAQSGSAGAIAPLYSALFVKNSGFVGISTVSPSCELHVVGRIMAGSGGYVGLTGDISASRDGAANTGAIYFGNSLSTYLYFNGSSFTFSPATSNLPSDARLKQNIHDLHGGIEVINRLRPIEAEWSAAAKVNIGRRVVSLIAQELQQVLPGAVTGQRGPNPGDEEYLAYDPQEIAMQCILAIQQLGARVKQLEGRN